MSDQSAVSDQSPDGEREFEVGVEGVNGDWEHIQVTAATPEEAYKEAESEADFFDLKRPVEAYQAFDIEEGVTHDR